MGNISDDKDNITLGDFCRQYRTTQGISAQDVADRSGGLIAKSYVLQIERTADVNLTVRKLKGLAKGLGVSEDLVFNLARGKNIVEASVDWEFEDLMNQIAEWSEENRTEAIENVKAILKRYSQKEKSEATRSKAGGQST